MRKSAGSDSEETEQGAVKRPRTSLHAGLEPSQPVSHIDRAIALGSAARSGSRITQIAPQSSHIAAKQATPGRDTPLKARLSAISPLSNSSLSASKTSIRRKPQTWNTSQFLDDDDGQLASSFVSSSQTTTASPSRVSLTSLHDSFALLDHPGHSHHAPTSSRPHDSRGKTSITARLPFEVPAINSPVKSESVFPSGRPVTPLLALPPVGTRGNDFSESSSRSAETNAISALPRDLSVWAASRGSPDSPVKHGKGFVKNALAERAVAVMKTARTGWVMWDYEQTRQNLSPSKGPGRSASSKQGMSAPQPDVIFRILHVYPPATSRLASAEALSPAAAFVAPRVKPSQVLALCAEESSPNALVLESHKNDEAAVDTHVLVVFSSAFAGTGSAGQSAFVNLDKILAHASHHSLDPTAGSEEFLTFEADTAIRNDQNPLRIAGWEPLYELNLDARLMESVPSLPDPRPARSVLCSRFMVLPEAST